MTVTADERLWIIFCELAEDMLGHSLDGDQATDGYSIDGAVAAFEEGASVVEFVLGVQAAKAETRSPDETCPIISLPPAPAPGITPPATAAAAASSGAAALSSTELASEKASAQ